MSEFNDYDLIFMSWLEYFEDPKALEQYRNSFRDDDFDEFFDQEAPEVDLSKYNLHNDDEWEEVTEVE